MEQTISSKELACIFCVSKDETRPQLHGIHVTRKFTEAADGHALVRVPRGSMTDIGSGAYECSTKKVDKLTENVIFRDNVDITGKHGIIAPIEGCYPNTDAVIQTILANAINETVKISLDIKLLVRLAKTINHGASTPIASHVTLEVPTKGVDMPIAVTSEFSDSAGVIMPLRMKDKASSPIEKLKTISKEN